MHGFQARFYLGEVLLLEQRRLQTFRRLQGGDCDHDLAVGGTRALSWFQLVILLGMGQVIVVVARTITGRAAGSGEREKMNVFYGFVGCARQVGLERRVEGRRPAATIEYKSHLWARLLEYSEQISINASTAFGSALWSTAVGICRRGAHTVVGAVFRRGSSLMASGVVMVVNVTDLEPGRDRWEKVMETKRLGVKVCTTTATVTGDFTTSAPVRRLRVGGPH